MVAVGQDGDALKYAAGGLKAVTNGTMTSTRSSSM